MRLVFLGLGAMTMGAIALGVNPVELIVGQQPQQLKQFHHGGTHDPIVATQPAQAATVPVQYLEVVASSQPFDMGGGPGMGPGGPGMGPGGPGMGPGGPGMGPGGPGMPPMMGRMGGGPGMGPGGQQGNCPPCPRMNSFMASHAMAFMQSNQVEPVQTSYQPFSYSQFSRTELENGGKGTSMFLKTSAPGSEVMVYQDPDGLPIKHRAFDGQRVTVLTENGGWYQIKTDTLSGWVQGV